MKILHFVAGTNVNVMTSYIQFVNSFFDEKQHIFVLLPEKKQAYGDIDQVYKNVFYRNKKELKRLLKRSEKIIVHSLFFSILDKIWLISQRPVLQKMVWVEWGGDLYTWKYEPETWMNRMKNKIQYTLRRRIPCFVGIFPPDIDYYRQQFGTSATCYYAPYVNNVIFEKLPLFETPRKADLEDSSKVKILLGHCASPVLKHRDTIDVLKKFSHENIEIIIPLVYGDKEYGEEIEKYAIDVFGGKATILKQMLDLESYFALLSTVDLAVFNVERQIALGNIIPLLYMNKKIYMPEKSVMFQYFRQNGIDIADIRLLSQYRSLQQIKAAQSDGAGQSFVKREYLDTTYIQKLWQNIFAAE